MCNVRVLQNRKAQPIQVEIEPDWLAAWTELEAHGYQLEPEAAGIVRVTRSAQQWRSVWGRRIQGQPSARRGGGTADEHPERGLGGGGERLLQRYEYEWDESWERASEQYSISLLVISREIFRFVGKMLSWPTRASRSTRSSAHDFCSSVWAGANPSSCCTSTYGWRLKTLKTRCIPTPTGRRDEVFFLLRT